MHAGGFRRDSFAPLPTVREVDSQRNSASLTPFTASPAASRRNSVTKDAIAGASGTDAAGARASGSSADGMAEQAPAAAAAQTTCSQEWLSLNSKCGPSLLSVRVRFGFWRSA